jgi:histidine triad (HIT) family protein
MSCIFCQIVSGESPARIVYRDGRVTAFHDLHPAAAVHILVVPDRHIASLDELTEADEPLAGHLLNVAREIAAREGLAVTGYRLIVNTGDGAGQSVFHLHVHLLGGKTTGSVR